MVSSVSHSTPSPLKAVTLTVAHWLALDIQDISQFPQRQQHLAQSVPLHTVSRASPSSHGNFLKFFPLFEKALCRCLRNKRPVSSPRLILSFPVCPATSCYRLSLLILCSTSLSKLPVNLQVAGPLAPVRCRMVNSGSFSRRSRFPLCKPHR